jgi:hypothetical protein
MLGGVGQDNGPRKQEVAVNVLMDGNQTLGSRSNWFVGLLVLTLGYATTLLAVRFLIL